MERDDDGKVSGATDLLHDHGGHLLIRLGEEASRLHDQVVRCIRTELGLQGNMGTFQQLPEISPYAFRGRID
jgi:hypothetical protein